MRQIGETQAEIAVNYHNLARNHDKLAKLYHEEANRLNENFDEE